MKIIVAKGCGLCGGAKRAVGLALDAASGAGRPVFTLGPIVHNTNVVEMLTARGVRVASSAAEVERGAAAVIRAHGVSTGELETLKERNVEIIDGTCARVSVIHEKIGELRVRGIKIYLAGDPEHAETAAHSSRGGADMIVVESVDALKVIDIDNVPSALIAQTSFDPGEFSAAATELRKRIAKLEVIDTLCRHMLKARAAAEEIARKADVMLVIGGRESANTARLAHRCRAARVKTVLIETSAELDVSDFTGADIVGLTAGASTPPESIDRALVWFNNNFSIEAVEGWE